MEKLNDNKKKDIREIGNSSSYIISQPLKAYTHLNNIELGSKIHHKIKSCLNDDLFIIFPLIQHKIMVDSNDWNHDER